MENKFQNRREFFHDKKRTGFEFTGKGNSTINEKMLEINMKREKFILEVPKGKSKEQIKKSVLSYIDEKQTIAVKRTTIYWSSVAAAVLLLIVNTLVAIQFSDWKISTEMHHASILLPDHSKIELGKGSQVSFNPVKWQLSRNVKLTGEAFFKVKKGERFKVNTSNGNVEVLGTSFNVFSRNDIFKVACYTGKVKVSDAMQKQYKMLLPGQELRNTDYGLSEIKSFSNTKDVEWIEGKFSYKEEPLINVLKELERQFNIKFIHKTSVNGTYTGCFMNADMEMALQMVLKPMGIDYYKTNSATFVLK